MREADGGHHPLYGSKQAVVEQPGAGVLEVGGGDEVMAHGGDELGESGAVECADGDKTQIGRASCRERVYVLV